MILVIDRDGKNASAFSDMLSYMGVVSQGTSAARALSMLSGIYSAAIVINPSRLADARDFLERARSYASVPIFVLAAREECFPLLGLIDGILDEGTSAAMALSAIREHCLERGLSAPGDYRLAGIDASVTERKVTYFSEPIALTKTETMLLRAFIRSYPAPLDAKSILEYVFRASRMPDVSNVRTHVSIINKKWREATGENIIETSPRDGYRLATARLRESATV